MTMMSPTATPLDTKVAPALLKFWPPEEPPATETPSTPEAYAPTDEKTTAPAVLVLSPATLVWNSVPATTVAPTIGTTGEGLDAEAFVGRSRTRRTALSEARLMGATTRPANRLPRMSARPLPHAPPNWPSVESNGPTFETRSASLVTKTGCGAEVTLPPSTFTAYDTSANSPTMPTTPVPVP